jgi:hypothetical protein
MFPEPVVQQKPSTLLSFKFAKKMSLVVHAWEKRIKTQPIDVSASEILEKYSN